MGRKGRIVTVLAGIALVAGIAVTAAVAGHQATPGLTATEIKIGGTFPLTGVASLYKTIPVAEKAYFDYVNDHGGVNGRKINFEILDDSYDPSKTVPLAQQLVEKDGVFAVFGSLGTAPTLATWGYLNSHKVPQVLVATGDSYWGFSKKKYPWTIGWQPDYPGEAKVYGKYIASNMKNAKIGVLYQNDAYGKNYYAGLRVGLGEAKVKIVDAESYDATNPSVTQQILALKSKGADTFVVFATPTPTITALVTATKVGWTPTATFINNVSSNRLFLLAAAGAGAKVDGVISTAYTASSTTQQNLAGVKLAPWVTGAHVAPTPVVSRPRRHSKPHLSPDGDGPARTLIVTAGLSSGLEPSDIIHAITAATGLDGESVRNVRMLEHFAFVEVPARDAERVVELVSGAEVRGHRLRVEAASG